MTALIFLDTETTGLRPDVHAPWEIAWVTAEHYNGQLVIRKQLTAFVALSMPVLGQADPDALRIGRFQERHPGAVHPSTWDPAEIIERLRADCADVAYAADQKTPHLVGAVPSFDQAMICQNWTGWPGFGEGIWHYHLIDVEILAAGHLGVAPPYSSDQLTAMMDVSVPEESKHTAAGDVEWAMKLYAAVYNLEIVR